MQKTENVNTELAVAEDLTDVIRKALWNSEYLIAICSPQYLGCEIKKMNIETTMDRIIGEIKGRRL